MSRLQNRCFFGATGLHALLLLALVVGPGFFQSKDVPSEPMIEVITLEATDAINPNPGTPGGGAKTEQARPPQPEPPPQQPPKVEPPQPRPRQPEPEPDRTPEPEPKEVPKPKTRDDFSDKPPKKKPEVKISNKTVNLNDRLKTNQKQTSEADTKAQERAQAQAQAQAVALANRLNKASANIGSGIAASTQIRVEGGTGGTGGAGLANYGQIVRKRYTDAWIMPTDLTDDEAVVRVSVTIARDGKVISARIVDSSGSSVAAASIQRTLDRVTHIGVPFPSSSDDAQRTFTMTFNLKAKKGLG